MTMWCPNISEKRGPRYLAIVDAIGEAVESGDLVVGDQLLPQREFAYRLGLTLGTVSRAFSLAQKRGLIRGEVGRGSFVCGNHVETPGLDFRAATASEIIDLSCFLPNGDRISREIAQILGEIAAEGGIRSLDRYPPGRGIGKHRSAGAAWISGLGYEVGADEVIVCPGAQQALAATIATITKPGDVIVTEALTYSGLKQLAHLFHLRTEGIAIDSEGILPDALAAACESSAARLLYVQPSIHNPTTAVMGVQRRKEIAEIARKFDLVVIEDTSCARFLNPPMPPVASFIPERTCLIAGTSKCLSPSLRTAFMTTPPELRSKVTATMHTLSLSSAPLMAEITVRLITRPEISSILEALAGELAARHATVDDVFRGFNIRHHPAAPYAWLKLPNEWRADDFTDAAKMDGVGVVGAERFAVGRINAPQDIRISVGEHRHLGHFRAGLEKLANLLTRAPRPQGAVV